MIALACDHGALDLKKAIMAHLDMNCTSFEKLFSSTKCQSG